MLNQTFDAANKAAEILKQQFKTVEIKNCQNCVIVLWQGSELVNIDQKGRTKFGRDADDASFSYKHLRTIASAAKVLSKAFI